MSGGYLNASRGCFAIDCKKVLFADRKLYVQDTYDAANVVIKIVDFSLYRYSGPMRLEWVGEVQVREIGIRTNTCLVCSKVLVQKPE